MRRGLNSIRRICREYKISGVFGPIIELLDCDEKYFTAVEVTAGNRYVKSILLCSLFSLLEPCSQSARQAGILAISLLTLCFDHFIVE